MVTFGQEDKVAQLGERSWGDGLVDIALVVRIRGVSSNPSTYVKSIVQWCTLVTQHTRIHARTHHCACIHMCIDKNTQRNGERNTTDSISVLIASFAPELSSYTFIYNPHTSDIIKL